MVLRVARPHFSHALGHGHGGVADLEGATKGQSLLATNGNVSNLVENLRLLLLLLLHMLVPVPVRFVAWNEPRQCRVPRHNTALHQATAVMLGRRQQASARVVLLPSPFA